MNNYTAAIASFIRYDVVIFNTLEYAMKKDSYDVNAFNARKEIIRNELEQNTPLKNCLDNSGEAGEKLKEKLNELLETVYSDSSTICKVAKDGAELRVDSEQALAVFDLVLPIHEEMRKIVEAHVIAARKAEAYDEPYDEVIKAEEAFYRGLVNMLMLRKLDSLFAEYNKARAEAKGAITPQSNFIQGDINKLVGLFNFVRGNAVITSNEYYEIIDPIFALIEMTSGRRDLPQGKGFGDVFNSTIKTTQEHTQKWELAWKPIYEKFISDFAKGVQEMQKNAAPNA